MRFRSGLVRDVFMPGSCGGLKLVGAGIVLLATGEGIATAGATGAGGVTGGAAAVGCGLLANTVGGAYVPPVPSGSAAGNCLG